MSGRFDLDRMRLIYTCAMNETSSLKCCAFSSGLIWNIWRMLLKWFHCCRNSSLYAVGSRLMRFCSWGRLDVRRTPRPIAVETPQVKARREESCLAERLPHAERAPTKIPLDEAKCGQG